MPVTATLDTIDHVLRMNVTGTLTTREMTDAIDSALAAIGDNRNCSVLSDHRLIETPATVDQLEAVIEHLRRYGRILHHRRWAVVTTLPASFGMMRMLSVLAQRIPMMVEVFQDMAAAEQWLKAAQP
jgi:hypothetical protein